MRARRIIAGVIAAILLAVLAAAADLVVEERFLAWAWPWLWGLACAACLVVVARPDSLDAWLVAGGTLAAVCAGRIAALWARVPDDITIAGQEAVSVQRAALGTALYVLILWLIGCTWWLASPRRHR